MGSFFASLMMLPLLRVIGPFFRLMLFPPCSKWVLQCVWVFALDKWAVRDQELIPVPAHCLRFDSQVAFLSSWSIISEVCKSAVLVSSFHHTALHRYLCSITQTFLYPLERVKVWYSNSSKCSFESIFELRKKVVKYNWKWSGVVMIALLHSKGPIVRKA